MDSFTLLKSIARFSFCLLSSFASLGISEMVFDRTRKFLGLFHDLKLVVWFIWILILFLFIFLPLLACIVIHRHTRTHVNSVLAYFNSYSFTSDWSSSSISTMYQISAYFYYSHYCMLAKRFVVSTGYATRASVLLFPLFLRRSFPFSIFLSIYSFHYVFPFQLTSNCRDCWCFPLLEVSMRPVNVSLWASERLFRYSIFTHAQSSTILQATMHHSHSINQVCLRTQRDRQITCVALVAGHQWKLFRNTHWIW